MARFYLTTAIDYANGDPHIGHAYEKIGADVIARYHRLAGFDVHFLIGMDEQGQKVAQGAADRWRPRPSWTTSPAGSGRCGRGWRSRMTSSSARPTPRTGAACGR